MPSQKLAGKTKETGDKTVSQSSRCSARPPEYKPQGSRCSARPPEYKPQSSRCSARPPTYKTYTLSLVLIFSVIQAKSTLRHQSTCCNCPCLCDSLSELLSHVLPDPTRANHTPRPYLLIYTISVCLLLPVRVPRSWPYVIACCNNRLMVAIKLSV